MKIAFRELQDVDVESVVTLWKRCDLTRPWNDPYKDIQFAREGETSTVLVGDVEGRVVASVMVGHDGHRGVLYYLAVDPEFQKRGYGKSTVAAGETWLRDRGVWKINLMVRSENEVAGRFYERMGYEINPVTSFGKRLDGL
ncbi:MAG TPA: GNAT family acetyltransferase [Aestuariivirga sp.]|nr:GNAT family acetyltransferase [Aestuariivirga sp.]